MRALMLGLVAAALAAGPATAAGSVPLLASPRAQDVAVAGSDVIVARDEPRAGVRVDALATTGGPARRLLTLPPRGRRWEAASTVAASPQRVAVVVVYEHDFEDVERQLYSGPVTGPLELVEATHAPAWSPIDVAVDGDRMLVLEAREPRTRLRVFARGAAPRVVPWPGAIGRGIAFAGDRVAFVGSASTKEDPTIDHAFLLDAVTGSRLFSTLAFDEAQLDLAPDGRVVVDGFVDVLTGGPGRPRRRVRSTGVLTGPRFAGDAIAALEFSGFGLRPIVLDPGTRDPRPVGPVAAEIREIDADERGVAWIGNGCVLYAPVDSVAPAEPPAGPCPRVEAHVHGADITLRGRRLDLDVDCVAAPATGCTGTAEIRGRGIVGRLRFHVPPNESRTSSVRIARRAARYVGRHVRSEGVAILPLTTRVVDGGPPQRDGIVVVLKVRR